MSTSQKRKVPIYANDTPSIAQSCSRSQFLLENLEHGLLTSSKGSRVALSGRFRSENNVEKNRSKRPTFKTPVSNGLHKVNGLDKVFVNVPGARNELEPKKSRISLSTPNIKLTPVLADKFKVLPVIQGSASVGFLIENVEKEHPNIKVGNTDDLSGYSRITHDNEFSMNSMYRKLFIAMDHATSAFPRRP